MMYYYKRKSNPFKWVIIILICMALGALAYWFYYNYFSKIDLNKPAENSNINSADISEVKFISGEISLLQGDVQVDIASKGYEKAISKAILHQGDRIKTGAGSMALLALEDGSKIRLGPDAEIILSNLAADNIVISQIKGRSYNNIAQTKNYEINFLKCKLKALGAIFEVLADDEKEILNLLVFENKVQLQVIDNEDIMFSIRLDANEKGIVDFKAAKKDLFKLEPFDREVLAKDEWYKWNFEQDKGTEDSLPVLEPDFEEVFDSLRLKAEANAEAIKLTWSAYNKDNFKLYKIIRSKTNSDLKYPENEVIKSSADKSLTSFTNINLESKQTYYYRVCAVKTSDKVACGNAVAIISPEKDTTPPASPKVSGEISAFGLSLTWTVNIENDFKEYRIFKSFLDAEPKYSESGYLAIRLKGVENYQDNNLNAATPGNAYYRVCSLDNSGNYACSNTVWVENGIIK